MTGLTPEQRQLIAQAGDQPVRIEDPETNEAYVFLREAVYRCFRGEVVATDPETDAHREEPETARPIEVPEGIRRSQEAFLRALPSLLAKRRLHGRWVVYYGDEQVGIARRPERLIRECVRRGLTHDQYYVACIRPHATEPEEIDPSFFEYEGFRVPPAETVGL